MSKRDLKAIVRDNVRALLRLKLVAWPLLRRLWRLILGRGRTLEEDMDRLAPRARPAGAVAAPPPPPLTPSPAPDGVQDVVWRDVGEPRRPSPGSGRSTLRKVIATATYLILLSLLWALWQAVFEPVLLLNLRRHYGADAQTIAQVVSGAAGICLAAGLIPLARIWRH